MVNTQTNRKPEHVIAGSTHVLKARQGLLKVKSSGTDYQVKAAF